VEEEKHRPVTPSFTFQHRRKYGKLNGNQASKGKHFIGFFFFFSFFRDRVSLCSLGCPGTHSVDQAGLELRDLPASASQVQGLKACATTPSTL
jgi:hypothetical protein